MLSGLFALLFIARFRPSVLVGAFCLRRPQNLIEPSFPGPAPSDFCVRMASRLHPASMLVLANGSCLMFDACAIDSASDNHFSYYKLVRPEDQPMLLLRTRAEGSTSPYHLLIEGIENATLAKDEDMSGNLYPYKNPVINMTPTPFSGIRLTLSNGSAPHVSLGFEMDSNLRVMDERAWFQRDNLNETMPWSVIEMQSEKYDVFDMKGYMGHSGGSRFAMILQLDTRLNCKNAEGYIIVIERNLCAFLITPFPGSYWWTPNGGPKKFSHGQLSLEYRLYGHMLPSSTVRWYERVIL